MSATKRTNRSGLAQSGAKQAKVGKSNALAKSGREFKAANAQQSRVSAQSSPEIKTDAPKSRNGHGGKRAGAGRPRGDGARRAAQILARREMSITDPVNFLLSIVADQKADFHLRMQAATAAAPFVKPKLSAVAVATPSSQAMLPVFPSAEELKKLVRGGSETKALPAPQQIQPQPVEKVPPPVRSLKRKPVAEPVIDRLEPYRDKSIGRGKPLEPEFP